MLPTLMIEEMCKNRSRFGKTLAICGTWIYNDEGASMATKEFEYERKYEYDKHSKM